MTVDVLIPPAFARDHIERELPSGQLLRQSAKGWLFRVTESELREWMSDAAHYSNCGGQGWDFGDGAGSARARGMPSSARATYRRCRAALDSF